MTNQKYQGLFEFRVGESEEDMLRLSSAHIISYLTESSWGRKPAHVVMPAGSTADKLCKELVKRLPNPQVNLKNVHFYVGEDFYPLSLEHPASFSGKLKRDFADKLGIPEGNMHYIDASKTLEQNLETLTRLNSENRALFIAGLNESGAICALRSSLQWKDSSLELVTLPLEQIAECRDPTWYKNVYREIAEVLKPEVIARYFPNEKGRPTHFITYGYLPIIQARDLVVIASGKKKRAGVGRFIEGLVISPNDYIGPEGYSDFPLTINRDPLQSNSLSEIINTRHIHPSYSAPDKRTIICLDRDAIPEVKT